MVSLETMIIAVVSFGVGILSRSASQIISYRYEVWHQQKTQKSAEKKQWYESTIQIANQVQDAKTKWENRNIPSMERDQWRFSHIVERLSTHQVNGEQLEVNDEVLDYLNQAEERCREVAQRDTTGAKGISSQIEAADESAQQLEQAAKEKI